MKKKLRALYYPYSRCLETNTLKRAILYFDEIVFIDPLHPDQRDNALAAAPSKASHHTEEAVLKRWPSIRDDYQYLADNKIVNTISPKPYLERWDLLFLAALQSDLSDDDFMRVSFQAGPMVWNMLRSKLPDSIFRMLDPRGMTFSEAMGWLEIQYTNHPSEVFKMPKPFGEYAKYVASGSITGDGDAYTLSYPQGASLNLTQAVLVAEQEDMSLITDNNIHYSLLLNRFKRAQSNPETETVRRIITQETPEELLKRSLVAVNIMDAVITKDHLESLSIEDCVELRDASKAELERFRVQVASLASEVAASPWDQDFEASLRKEINTKILPELMKFQDGINNIYRSLFGRLAKKAVGGIVGGGSSLIASVIAGLPPFALLTLSCSVLTTVMGVTAVELIEAMAEEKKMKQNTFHYLLKAIRSK